MLIIQNLVLIAGQLVSVSFLDSRFLLRTDNVNIGLQASNLGSLDCGLPRQVHIPKPSWTTGYVTSLQAFDKNGD